MKFHNVFRCIEILSDFRNHYGRESTDAIQSAVSLNVQFQTVISDINTEVLAVSILHCCFHMY